MKPILHKIFMENIVLFGPFSLFAGTVDPYRRTMNSVTDAADSLRHDFRLKDWDFFSPPKTKTTGGQHQ